MSSQGLTIAEAAEALGLSERTIRRQIKSGKIKAELVLGRYGAEYRISGPGETAVARPRVDKAPASTLDKAPTFALDKTLDKTPASALDKAIDKTLDKALDMVKSLQQEKAELYAQVAYWQAQFQHLEEQVKLLTEAKRPWWRRWLRRRR